MLWIATLLLACWATFHVGMRLGTPALPPAAPEWGWLILEPGRLRLLEDNRVVLDLIRINGALRANGKPVPPGKTTATIAIPLNGNAKP